VKTSRVFDSDSMYREMRTMIDFVHIPKNAGTSIRELCAPNLPSSFISYHGHGTDPNTLQGEQLIILREPKDRFCSAVRYSLAYMRDDPGGNRCKFHEFETKGLLNPGRWAEALADVNNVHHELIKSEVSNVEHKVGNMHLDDRWTFAPQYIWLNRCRYPRVALFHQLKDDMHYLFMSMEHSFPSDIPQENAIPDTEGLELSIVAQEYLNKKYQEDIVIFNKYSTIPRSIRMRRQNCS